VRSVAIFTNEEKDQGLEYTNVVKDFLEKQDIQVSIGYSETVDLLVVLGGDGTVLNISHKAAIDNIPVLGINLGTMGFLTDVDKKDGIFSLEKVLANNFITENRIMLEVHRVTPLEQRLALNEVCVGATGKLKTFDLYISNQFIDTIRADGIIISTPTGSTAYNLSAGGPILSPCGQMFVVTPICPHSLGSRPFVLSPSDSVRIIARNISPVIIDGEEREPLLKGEDIVVNKAAKHVTIMKTVVTNFYETLRKKKIL